MPASPWQVEFANLQSDDEVVGVLARNRPDVLVHLAMAYQPPGVAPSPEVDDVNFRSTVRLAEQFFLAGGRRFVFAGTCFEYGHLDLEQIPETAPCRPTYGYAAAKAKAGEAVLSLADRLGCEGLVLRVFSPYGPLEDAARIVPQLIRASLRGDALSLSPGEQVRDYTQVGDVAAAFVAAATHSAPRHGVYNVCTGIGLSLRELASCIERAARRPLRLLWGAQPYRTGEMMRLVGDPAAAERDLGWRPRLSLGDGLAETVAWWQDRLANDQTSELRRASA